MAFDWAILDFVQGLRTPFGDWLMPWFGALGEFGFIWIVLTLILLIIPKTRRVGIVLALALLIDVLTVDVFIKHLVARPRPFILNPSVELIVDPPSSYSFPSGHSAVSFAAASALFFARSKLWIPAGILAACIAFSRIYVYVHYPTDVLAGIALGILIGYVANKIVDALMKRKSAMPPGSSKSD